MHPQPGIFALGTSDHSYLEFDLSDTDAFLRRAASLNAGTLQREVGGWLYQHDRVTSALHQTDQRGVPRRPVRGGAGPFRPAGRGLTWD